MTEVNCFEEKLLVTGMECFEGGVVLWLSGEMDLEIASGISGDVTEERKLHEELSLLVGEPVKNFFFRAMEAITLAFLGSDLPDAAGGRRGVWNP